MNSGIYREPDAGVEYRCFRCGGIFPHTMTEAEAEAIYERDFPGGSKVGRVWVCWNCYDATITTKTTTRDSEAISNGA